ncbi:MAG TPA: hypothetical protein VEV16_00170 [Daejeonella sp.]|nr:hypothetical protein [Daejeonella sp.]
MLFVNLSQNSIIVLAIITIITVFWAIYEIMRYERGLAQILWLLSAIFIPPLSVVYILRSFFWGEKK